MLGGFLRLLCRLALLLHASDYLRYVSIRQHMPAYAAVLLRRLALLLYAPGYLRMRYVSMRQHTSAQPSAHALELLGGGTHAVYCFYLLQGGDELCW